MSGETIGPGVAAASFSSGRSVAAPAPSMGEIHSVPKSSVTLEAPKINANSFNVKEGPVKDVTFQSLSRDFAPVHAFDPTFFEKPPSEFGKVNISKDTTLVWPSENPTQTTPASRDSKPDIFEKTVPYITDAYQVPEKAIPKEILKDTEIIVLAPSLDSHSENKYQPDTKSVKADKVTLFDSPVLNAAEAISTHQESTRDVLDAIQTEPTTQPSVLEAYVESITMESNRTTNATDVIENIKSENPAAYAEIQGDMEIAGHISELLADLNVDPNQASEMVQREIGKTLERKGLAEVIEKAVDEETDFQEDTKPKTETNLKTSSKSGTQTSEDEEEIESEEQTLPEKQPQFVRDEEANRERKAKIEIAIDEVYSAKNDQEQVTGAEVVAALPPKPTKEETSEIVKDRSDKPGTSPDGSIPEVRVAISDSTFQSKNDAKIRSEKIVDQKTAVRKAVSGTVVSPEDVARVLSDKKIKEQIIYKAA